MKIKEYFRQYKDILILALSGGLLFFGWQAAENYLTPFYKISNQTPLALKALSLLYGSIVIGHFIAPLFSAKFGLKTSLIFGFITYPLFVFSALSKNYILLFPAAILLGIGAGIKGIAEIAYIGAISPKDKRGSFSGFYWAATRIGASFSLIFALIYLKQSNYLLFYLILGLIALFATIFLLLKLVEPKDIESIKINKNKQSLKLKILEILNFLTNKKVLLLAPSGIAGGFIFSLITGKIPVTIQTLHGIKWIAILSIIFQVSRSILTEPMGRLSDKIGRFKLKYLSIILAILGACFFLLSKSVVSLISTLFLFGLVYAIDHSNGPALSLDIFEEKIQTASAASSILNTFLGIIPGFLLSAFKSDNYLIIVAIILNLIGLVTIKILEVVLVRERT